MLCFLSVAFCFTLQSLTTEDLRWVDGLLSLRETLEQSCGSENANRSFTDIFLVVKFKF